VNELGGRLQVEGLALFGEDKRSDGVDVLLFHALYLHLSFKLWQRVHRQVAQVGQTGKAVLGVLGIGARGVGVVADAAHSGALHCCQLEFAEGLKGRQLEYFELLF